MSTKLTSLVEAEDQPELYLYVATHLGTNIREDDSYFSTSIRIRKGMIEKLFLALFGRKLPPVLDKAGPDPQRDLVVRRRQLEELLQIPRLQKERELLEAVVRQLLREKPDVLRERLTDRNATVRFLTIQVIARRRLPLERALIERLADRDRAVAEAARAALVRLGRGVDFGPVAKATRAQRHQAVQRWSEWLVLQEKTSRPAGLPGTARFEVLARPSTE